MAASARRACVRADGEAPEPPALRRRLLAQTLSSQQVEAKADCNVLNRMTSFDMPTTIRIG
jgi:hypothetical protein